MKKIRSKKNKLLFYVKYVFRIFIYFLILVALYFRIKRTLKRLKYLSLEVDYAKVLSLCLCDHEF